MEKEIEASKRMKENSYYVNDKNMQEDVSILEQALLELKAIKEAKPSEAMECWNWLNATIPQWCREKDKEHPDTLAPIKQYILKAQELEKVLEIIKDLLGKHCKIELVNGGTYYQVKIKIMGSGYSFGMSITKEEFDALNKNLPKER